MNKAFRGGEPGLTFGLDSFSSLSPSLNMARKIRARFAR
jgi:hypothetical protein